jgi:hypothetical protein
MNNEQGMLKMMDFAIGRIANDPNVSTEFRNAVKIVKPVKCFDCGIDIVDAGQEISYANDDVSRETPLCEDCKTQWDYEAEQEWRDEQIHRRNHGRD